MLEETNPVLLRTALDEYLRFRRGDPELTLSLRPILFHPDPGFRRDAVRIIEQIVERHPRADFPEVTALRGELVSRATRDSDEEVRIAAIQTLGAFDHDEVDEVLAEIAREDPEQTVRFTAERILLERQRQRSSPGPFESID
jgi:HEAT repeat protein